VSGMNESPYKALYLQEVSERLSGIEKGLLSLESSPGDKTVVDALFRHYHSIKGMSASMGFEAIKDFAHLQEDVLEGFRSAGSFPGKVTVSVLFECLDALKKFLLMVENSAPLELDTSPLVKRLKESVLAGGVARPGAEPPAGQEGGAAIAGSMQISRTIKVEGRVFDSLLKTTGNLLTVLSGLKDYASIVRSIKLKDLTHELEKSIQELNSDILSARMLPFGDLTQNLPRIIRDISARYGKEVNLVVEGADITLDRSILEGMGDPLVHIMKNALDHGIEPVAERKSAGKPERGTITVKASQKKDMVLVEVTDDGRGIDPERLRQKAIEKGIERERLDKMTAKELINLVCLPGLSLAESVTDISGRGVGMDIVATAVNSLGGKLDIKSEYGKGASISMELPKAASITRILFVKTGATMFALPISRVEKIIMLNDEAAGSEVDYLGSSIPAKRLSDAFAVKGSGKDRVAVVARDEKTGNPFAIIADEYGDEMEAFVRPLRPPFENLDFATGFTITGDGRPVFVLDIIRLAPASGKGVSS